MDETLSVDFKTIIDRLIGKRLPIHNELVLQDEINLIFSDLAVEREFALDSKSRIDFYLNGIGIEVKIKGGKMNIFRQVKRYCEHPKIRAIILVTSTAITLPLTINNKPCYVVSLGTAWL